MFFEGDRITFMRQMILAADEKQRRAALRKLLPFQRKDFTVYLKQWVAFPSQFVSLIHLSTNSFLTMSLPSAS
jgi:phosphoenolpyruvate synthase/pyruvate phosphate dikinase